MPVHSNCALHSLDCVTLYVSNNDIGLLLAETTIKSKKNCRTTDELKGEFFLVWFKTNQFKSVALLYKMLSILLCVVYLPSHFTPHSFAPYSLFIDWVCLLRGVQNNRTDSNRSCKHHFIHFRRHRCYFGEQRHGEMQNFSPRRWFLLSLFPADILVLTFVDLWWLMSWQLVCLPLCICVSVCVSVSLCVCQRCRA